MGLASSNVPSSERRRTRRRGWLSTPALGFVLSFCAAPWASAGETSTVPLAAYAAQLSAARGIARGCAAGAAACTAAGLPGRERVGGAPGGAFTASWQWFEDALTAAKTASPPQRLATMQAADLHLQRLSVQSVADGSAAPTAFAAARAAANAALAREEFRASEGPSWLERRLAHLQDWFLSLFNGMDRLGRKAPWLAPLIEWGCFGLAVAGLLWFVRQSLQRGALRITLTEGAPLARDGEREEGDWAQRAEAYATAANWREAVHCLYWAAIALMEGRRAWRPNVTRTPREYLRLLRPGSDAQRALRELTRGFERVWYGDATAGEAQYREAQRSLEALRTARPERAEIPGADAAALPAAGGA